MCIMLLASQCSLCLHQRAGLVHYHKGVFGFCGDEGREREMHIIIGVVVIIHTLIDNDVQYTVSQ